jgi:hypothetical protein
LGRLPEGFNFFEVTRKCRSIGISNDNSGEYSHREFYRKVENFGLGGVNVFLMDGEVVLLPCENKLFEYSRRFNDVGEISQDD